MSDTELIALAALVQHETMYMTAENVGRDRNGYAQAYVEPSNASLQLEAELKLRGILPR